MAEATSERPGAGITSGELIRRYRLFQGLTQEELAVRSSFSAEYIRKLERGARQPPLDTLNRLADTFELSETERAALLATRRHSAESPAGAGTLAGRAREMAEIRRHLAGLGPPVLLFSGEPGIGKTRLLDAATSAAANGGWRVVRGGCQRWVSDPYAPFTEAVAGSLGQLSGDERDEALRVASRLHLLLPELVPVADTRALPHMTGRTSGPPLQAEQERRLLFMAIADYLRVVARDAGTLLVLDDLQWAGQDALGLLMTLANLEGTPALRVIGAYRDTGGDEDPVASLVAELARTSRVQVLTLDPLSDDEAAQLLTRLLPGKEASQGAILRRAGGNPFFLMSYAEELHRRGAVDEPIEPPWTVTQVILGRLRDLPEAARELLGVAAIVGRAVTPSLLMQVSGRDDDDVLEALEAAARARIMVEDDEGAYAFHHDLIRETIEQDLSGGRRRLLHRRIAEALAHSPLPGRERRAAEIAGHFLQGDKQDAALSWILQAGDAAASVFANSEAEREYRTAAELAHQLGDERVEGDALDRLGDVLYRWGRYADALTLLERAEEICRRLADQDRYLRTVARIGEMCTLSGRAAQGLDLVLPIIQSLESANTGDVPPGAADVYAALSGLYLAAGRVSDALETAERAASLAEGTGNQRALCLTDVTRGLALGAVHRVREQSSAFEYAARIAESLDDPWLLALAVYHRGLSYFSADDFGQGERLVRRALGIADGADFLGWSSFIRSTLADLLVRHGRWAEARGEVERADSDRRYLGPGPGVAFPLISLGRIMLLQGEREEGLRRVQEALAVASQFQHAPGLAGALEVLAWQDIRDSKPEAALARLEPLLERRRIAGHPWHSAVYAWALLEAGRHEQAAEVLSGARQIAASSTSRAGLPDVLLQSGRLAMRLGRATEAVRDLEEGLTIARELDLVYDEALLLEAKGCAHDLMGEPEAARSGLLESLSVFKRLGAVPDAERVEQSLNAFPYFA